MKRKLEHLKEIVMKLNKTLLAALMLTVTLTGCNMAENKNTGEAPVVEENPDGTAPTEKANPVDPNATNENPTENEDSTESEDSAAGVPAEEGDEATTDSETGMDEANDTPAVAGDVGSQREMLEKAIFDNRTQARAIELLFELSPDKVEHIRPQLQQLLDASNELLAVAQEELDRLNAAE